MVKESGQKKNFTVGEKISVQVKPTYSMKYGLQKGITYIVMHVGIVCQLNNT